LRNPGLRIIPMHSGRRSKNARLEIELSPWLENGFIRVSDADTPFLIALRAALDSYPFHDEDDTLDSLYYAARGMPDVLVMPKAGDELPEYGREKTKMVNPMIAFGRH
jgi:hypothetical protein